MITPTPDEKLQKVLARAGYGSRREIEGWISAGRISVNGKICQLGERVSDTDVIRIDGNVVSKTRLQSKRSRERVTELMKSLPPDQVQILAKGYMEGKSHAEAAAELDLPLGTVKSRVRLAIQKLQLQIES